MNFFVFFFQAAVKRVNAEIEPDGQMPLVSIDVESLLRLKKQFYQWQGTDSLMVEVNMQFSCSSKMIEPNS